MKLGKYVFTLASEAFRIQDVVENELFPITKAWADHSST